MSTVMVYLSPETPNAPPSFVSGQHGQPVAEDPMWFLQTTYLF